MIRALSETLTQAMPEPGTRSAIDWGSVSRVLLIRLRSIGDTVLMTPCIEAIKSWRPDIEIATVSEPLSAPLLDTHPSVDHTIIVEPSFKHRAKLITRLRRRRFDVAFNLHGGPTATLIAALSGARFTVGYHGYSNSWMLTEKAPSPDLLLGRSRLHSVEQQLALLNWTGVPWPQEGPELKIGHSDHGRLRLLERLDRLRITNLTNLAVVAPGAALESKRWPARDFAAVAEHLSHELGLTPILLTGPGQNAIAQEVGCGSSSSRVVSETAPSLPESIELIRLAKIFVGNDSGLMHIAAALRRPIVVIFGSSDPTVWRPWTTSETRVVAGSRRPDGSIDWPAASVVIRAIDDAFAQLSQGDLT